MQHPKFTRRDGLLLGGLLGLSCLRPRDVDARTQSQSTAKHFGKAKRCVLVWLDGGPSHLEMFDPKPLATAEVRGPLSVIKTKVAGVDFGEGLPQLAQRLNRFTVIRSLTSPVGEHNLATQYALSGHIPGGRAAAPAFMLPVASHVNGIGPLPVHIAVPNFQLGGGSNLQGFMSDSILPWSLDADPQSPDFAAKVIANDRHSDLRRLARRRKLLEQSTSETSPSLLSAIDLLKDVDSQAAFDLTRETESTRTRYGAKSIGQCCLLARRMLESGVPLITINNVGWDTHDRLHERLHAGYTGAKVPVGLIPAMDQAVAALLDDLRATGLIDETLVVVMGEFGRTPKINAQGGRDHWPRAYSVMLAGAGVAGGQVLGATDRIGEVPIADAVTPGDLVGTMYHLLGLDPGARQSTPDGQQLVRVPEQARVIDEILS